MSVPSAPFTFMSAQTVSGAITLRWEPPATTGGSHIRGYVVTCEGVPTQNIAADARDCVVTGLDNQSAYMFQISATNAYGNGPAATFPLAQPMSSVNGYQ